MTTHGAWHQLLTYEIYWHKVVSICLQDSLSNPNPFFPCHPYPNADAACKHRDFTASSLVVTHMSPWSILTANTSTECNWKDINRRLWYFGLSLHQNTRFHLFSLHKRDIMISFHACSKWKIISTYRIQFSDGDIFLKNNNQVRLWIKFHRSKDMKPSLIVRICLVYINSKKNNVLFNQIK